MARILLLVSCGTDLTLGQLWHESYWPTSQQPATNQRADQIPELLSEGNPVNVWSKSFFASLLLLQSEFQMKARLPFQMNGAPNDCAGRATVNSYDPRELCKSKTALETRHLSMNLDKFGFGV